jgi:FixJ family two-component response regulator
MNSKKPTIWIIDSEQWPRACLRAELIERGYDAVGFVRAGQALSAILSGRSSTPGAIVLELRGQAIKGNVLDLLGATNIPLVLLGGSVEVNDPAAQNLKAAVILKRPITLGEIVDALQGVVSREPHARGARSR